MKSGARAHEERAVCHCWCHCCDQCCRQIDERLGFTTTEKCEEREFSVGESRRRCRLQLGATVVGKRCGDELQVVADIQEATQERTSRSSRKIENRPLISALLFL